MVPPRTLAAGPAPVALGSAAHFAILADSSISSTGGGAIDGDVGLSTGYGSSITGLLSNQVNGIIYAVDSSGPAGSVPDPGLLSTAKFDFATAYTDASGRSADRIPLTAAENLGGQTLAPGLYGSPSSLQIAGDLTLDAGGDPDAVWIFQMPASTLTTADGPGNSRVILAGGAQARNIFWQVGSSATIGTFSDFKGTILAALDITLGTSCAVEGRALAGRDLTYNGESISLPAHVTLALLARLEAQVESGRVVVEWETASEVGTAGYYLYRLGAEGTWAAVGQGMHPAVPGAAQGAIYRLTDAGALPGGTYTYKLVEIESKGSTREFAPRTVTAPAAAGKTAASGLPGSSPAFSARARTDAASLASVPAKQSLPATLGNGNGTWLPVRVGAGASGVYRLGADALAATLGVSSNEVLARMQAGALALACGGAPVAWQPAGSGDGVLFYGAAAESIYTTENAYRLTWAAGARMAHTAGAPPAAGSAASELADTAHFEQDLFSAAGLADDPDSDYWMWQSIVAGDETAGTRQFGLDVKSPAGRGAARLTVHAQGATSTGTANEHHLRVSVNGNAAGEVRWTGLGMQSFGFDLDAAGLLAGSNTVALTGLLDSGAPYSVIYVDSFDLSYVRTCTAVNDQYRLHADSAAPVTVGGFTQPGIEVLDISTPAAPKAMDALAVAADGPAWRASFTPSAGGGDYVVFAAAFAPASVSAIRPSDLKAATNAAEYVIVTAAALDGSAQALAAYRESTGWRSQVVWVEDIYDQFGFGVPTPRALDAFVKYAAANWATPPRFVVLAGAATYDYCNRLGYGGNIVPPLLVSTPFGLFASDTALGDVNGDGVPEVAVGRLPARTAAELDALVGKIESYEKAAAGTWQRRIVLAADNPDEGGDFDGSSESVSGLVDPAYARQRVYLSELGAQAAHAALAQDWNAGAAFLNYFGHGAMDRLAEEALLTSADAANLVNGSQLPIVTAMTCVLGQFAVPGYACLGVNLLVQPTGGAVAVWAPSGLSWNESAQKLGEEFYAAIFARGKARVGDAVRDALGRAAAEGVEPSMLGIYNLLGDPALRLTARAAVTFDDWKRDTFSAPQLADAGVGADTADPDADGLVNWVEYALGTDPHGGNAAGMSLVRGPADGPDAGYDMVVQLNRRAGVQDVQYWAEVSVDLVHWQVGAPVAECVAPDAGGLTETVIWYLRTPDPTRQRGFARLNVGR